MQKGRFLILCAVVIVGFGVFFLRRPRGSVEIPAAVLFPGFTMEIYAQNLKNPRVIAFDPRGRMLVSETSAGRVTVVGQGPIIENLDNPHGLAFYQNYLYVASTREVVRYPYDIETATADAAKKQNIATLPVGGMHFTRTIGFGKDFRDEPLIIGQKQSRFASPVKLYISVGSSCDACLENTWKYAAILESDPEGTYTAEVAGGLRDAEFFTFHPTTGALWASEQNRAGFSDEINIIKPTLKYGWPDCPPTDCDESEPPEIELPADADPLGLAFLSPTELLVAYKNKIVRFDENKQPSDFMTGRFADLKFDDQGNLYISDDTAGIIYRVAPAKP